MRSWQDSLLDRHPGPAAEIIVSTDQEKLVIFLFHNAVLKAFSLPSTIKDSSIVRLESSHLFELTLLPPS